MKAVGTDLAQRAVHTAAATRDLRRYRCTYTPRDAFGHLHPSDTGTLPFVQVKAANAEAALISAQHVTGCPVAQVERLEQAG